MDRSITAALLALQSTVMLDTASVRAGAASATPSRARSSASSLRDGLRALEAALRPSPPPQQRSLARARMPAAFGGVTSSEALRRALNAPGDMRADGRGLLGVGRVSWQ